MQVLGHQITAQDFSLKALVNKLENSIITLSGPAIAISGIIAGIDLLTGGTMFKSVAWLSLTWAICLLLTLDFQVLMLGAKAKRIYATTGKKGWQKFGEILLIILIAAAISSVSVQMQSIIARSQATTTYTDKTGQHTRNLTIDEATQQMGINPIALIWERSALVLILIFMSGWLRDEEHQDDNTSSLTPNLAPATIDYNQVAQAIMPLLAPQLQGLKATIVAEIKPILAPEPLDYQKLAQHVGPILAPTTQAEPLNYQEIAKTLAPILAPDYQEIATRIAPILAPEPAQVLDYQEIANTIAPLLKPQFTEVRRFIIEEVKAAIPQLVAPTQAHVPLIEAKNGTDTTSQSQETEPDLAESPEQRDARLEATYQELRAILGKRVSGRQLADKAKANRGYCTKWLQDHHPENEAKANIGTEATGQSQQNTEPIPVLSH